MISKKFTTSSEPSESSVFECINSDLQVCLFPLNLNAHNRLNIALNRLNIAHNRLNIALNRLNILTLTKTAFKSKTGKSWQSQNNWLPGNL